MSFLLKRKIIHAAVTAAEKFIVEVIRMVPLCMIVVVGAIGTLIVNILRIAPICVIGVNAGLWAAPMFHSYYEELYFIVRILFYFFAIICGIKILAKLLKGEKNRQQTAWLRRLKGVKTSSSPYLSAYCRCEGPKRVWAIEIRVVL